ncbi:MAG: hypothetical protein JEY94_16640 [Melioribacteraceae bacterium]|nr:hypothetical protein [Melioribacteraceae bacterium]
MKAYFLLIILFIISACAPLPISIMDEIQLEKITSNHFSEWSLEECEFIIAAQTSSNINHYTSYEAALSISKDRVFIDALPLNEIVIKALVRKTAIEKRLNNNEYKNLLNHELINYAGLELNDAGKIVPTDIPTDSLSFSFKITFENVSNPYRPIIFEDGYSYFFLENKEGMFARVKEISGFFVEDDFILNDFLTVIITFKIKDDNNNSLFNIAYQNYDYSLVFNGLQPTPIKLSWEKANY